MSGVQSSSQSAAKENARRAQSRRAFGVWNALTWGLWPVAGLYTLSRLRGKKAKSRAWLRAAWGDSGRHVRGDIWIHAVSVGETMAARPLARALRDALPERRIVVSSTTETGHETAQALVRDGLCDVAIYYPVDVPFAVQRALNRVRPRVVVLMETELWPSFLHLAQARGARVVLANGRVSDNLNATARRFAPLFRWMLGNVDAPLMRSEFDAERMAQLPVPPDFAARVRVVGDVKLDRPQGVARDEAARHHWRTLLGIAEAAPLWIAGSTHEGEEEQILAAYSQLRQGTPNLRLLIAPRHIDRTDEVAALIEDKGYKVVRRSAAPFDSSAQDAVLLLDTVGELSALYAAGEMAFVGGSLIQRGGHNLLEPVLTGAPVVFGPHVANFREAAQLAQDAKLGTQVANVEELSSAVATWLSDGEGREAIPERADRALQAHRGAARRVAEVVAGYLELTRRE